MNVAERDKKKSFSQVTHIPVIEALLEAPLFGPNQPAERPIKGCIVMSNDVLSAHHWRV